MRRLYSFLLYLLIPYFLFRLWWKGRRLPAYRERIAERFFLDKEATGKIDLWVHAVSLGEVIAVTPLIDALLNKGWRILITTMTPTGAEQAKIQFGEKVAHRYVPYDLPWVLNRFFKKTRPRLGLIVETELWPNLIYYAGKLDIPLFLINARLSERSCQGYKKIIFLIRPILNQFHSIFVQSEDDAQRFKSLGADASRVVVLGNMKFDLQIQKVNSAIFQKLKEYWGRERTILLLASTHDDEEFQIISRLRSLQKNLDMMVLLIAPRHPERFQAVYELCIEQGFNTGLRSKPETLSLENQVVVLDSLGELLGFYQMADYAFVGGSLVPVGGHNVLEPIAMKVPVLSGPEFHNFKTIFKELILADAIELAANADDLVQKIIALHQNHERRKSLIQNATQVLEANKGAVERYLTKVEGILELTV